MARTHLGRILEGGYLIGFDHRTGRFLCKRLAKMTIVGIRPSENAGMGLGKLRRLCCSHGGQLQRPIQTISEDDDRRHPAIRKRGDGPRKTSAALLQSRLPNCRGLFKLWRFRCSQNWRGRVRWRMVCPLPIRSMKDVALQFTGFNSPGQRPTAC